MKDNEGLQSLHEKDSQMIEMARKDKNPPEKLKNIVDFQNYQGYEPPKYSRFRRVLQNHNLDPYRATRHNQKQQEADFGQEKAVGVALAKSRSNNPFIDHKSLKT